MIELKIASYQYPEIKDGDWDSNWLNIYLNVKSELGHWQTVDPSLTTWDVQRLIKWFEYLSNNLQPEHTDICFLEPYLSFELLNSFDSEPKTIRIKFDLEFRPQSATNDQEYFVDFIADNQELKRIKLDLEKELGNYPERKPAQARGNWWQKLFSSE